MHNHRSLFPARSRKEFQDLCTLVGLMTLDWAWAETALAAGIAIINKYAGPIAGHPKAPVSLKMRVSYLRVALREIPTLHIVQEDGRALAVRFVELGKRRNDFVHSAAWQRHEGGFQSIAFAIVAGGITRSRIIASTKAMRFASMSRSPNSKRRRLRSRSKSSGF